MINLRDGETIIERDGKKIAILHDCVHEGEYVERHLSDTCICGKPTNFNRFWTSDGEHQLCQHCTLFTISGILADKGFKKADE